MSTDDEQKCGNEKKPAGDQGPSGCDAPIGHCYEICIGGHLDGSWSEWFEGLEIRPCGKNRTLLRGRVADQAALLGILNKLSRLNIPLVSVSEVVENPQPASPGPQGVE